MAAELHVIEAHHIGLGWALFVRLRGISSSADTGPSIFARITA